jgi:hypothetical protein
LVSSHPFKIKHSSDLKKKACEIFKQSTYQALKKSVLQVQLRSINHNLPTVELEKQFQIFLLKRYKNDNTYVNYYITTSSHGLKYLGLIKMKNITSHSNKQTFLKDKIMVGGKFGEAG